jgi:flagellar biosynthesis protein FlhB
MHDAERNLRKLRKALKKGNVSLSAELLAALQSDAARLATVLAFAAAEKQPDSPHQN